MEINEQKKKDEPIFGTTSFSDVLKDIYDNSGKKRKQIDILVNELRALIKQVSDAAMIVPLIKEYLDIAIKNDEQLVKMAAVYQKYMAAETRLLAGFGKATGAAGSALLTDAEKEQLLAEINAIVQNEDEIQNDEIQVTQDLKNLIKDMDAIKNTVGDEKNG